MSELRSAIDQLRAEDLVGAAGCAGRGRLRGAAARGRAAGGGTPAANCRSGTRAASHRRDGHLSTASWLATSFKVGWGAATRAGAGGAGTWRRCQRPRGHSMTVSCRSRRRRCSFRLGRPTRRRSRGARPLLWRPHGSIRSATCSGSRRTGGRWCEPRDRTARTSFGAMRRLHASADVRGHGAGGRRPRPGDRGDAPHGPPGPSWTPRRGRARRTPGARASAGRTPLEGSAGSGSTGSDRPSVGGERPHVTDDGERRVAPGPGRFRRARPCGSGTPRGGETDRRAMPPSCGC